MSDIAAGGVVILANVTVAGTALAVGRRLFPGDPPGWQLLHALVIWLALVIEVGLALGAVDGLTPAAYPGIVVGGCLLYWWRVEGGRQIPRCQPGGWAVCWSTAGLLAVAVVQVCGVERFPADWDALCTTSR